MPTKRAVPSALSSRWRREPSEPYFRRINSVPRRQAARNCFSLPGCTVHQSAATNIGGSALVLPELAISLPPFLLSAGKEPLRAAGLHALPVHTGIGRSEERRGGK